MSSPPVRRDYDNSRRARAADETRDRILAAFAAQLAEPGCTELSPAAAARTAGVSVRTVHHHFPDRTAQISALADWLDRRAFGEGLEPPHDTDDLRRYVLDAYRGAARDLAMTRAMVTAGSAASAIRHTRRAPRLRAIRHVLEEIDAPDADTKEAVAVVSMLSSADAGLALVDRYGLTIEEAGAAAAAAVEAVVARLQSRARESPR